MNIFNVAYLRLTAWYVAIIMSISLLFSVWVYNQAARELSFGLNRVVQIGPLVQFVTDSPRNTIAEHIKKSQRNLMTRLVLLNVGVLVVGAAASYALARRTMMPIVEAVDAQHRFTADASHELRTPLAAMKAEIEVGLRDKNLSKAEAVELLESNLEEIDRMGKLADGLLALTQVESKPQAAEMDLDEVVAKVVKRMGPLAEAKKITIKTDLKKLTINSDNTAIDKIVSILLDNAIKYSPDKSQVVVSAYQKGRSTHVQIKDQGVGIKASDMPHIFDRFYRADVSRSQVNASGNGLGLSIAKKLAEDLGGKLTATSEPGSGSTFSLIF